jgi:transcriptional accessory protein Tex/SPT6
VYVQEMITIADLKEGEELMGTVTNVVPFGAFCDIGIGAMALCHISQLSTETSVGQQVEATSLVSGAHLYFAGISRGNVALML